MRTQLVAAVAAAAVSFAAGNVCAAQLTGAGGTAIYPLLSEWAAQYQKETNDSVNYQAIGSGGGIKQIEEKKVLFANTDMPLKPEDVAKNNLVQWPQVIVSITPIVHLRGIMSGELVLDGPTLADIYLGNIQEWDDPAIRKLNPSVKLPHQVITTVHRSDSSGTTFNFTNYLSKVSAQWKSKVGDGAVIKWPNGVSGKGNRGVASYVKQIDGTIGYVEYAYVIEKNLISTDMINKAGKRVKPAMEAFQAAAGNADFTKAKHFYPILTDQPGDESWPIMAVSYMLLRKDSPPDQNHLALMFLDWCLKNGQAQAKALDYVPLSDDVIKQIEGHWHNELPDAWKMAAE